MTKTDNANLGAKLALRRYFLRRYHAGAVPQVFDACQGSGIIWGQLREEFKVRYWGVDVKPEKGRVQINSERVLAQPGWRFDVVDVDTYGAPWKHWVEIIRHLDHPATVFLTVGAVHSRVLNTGSTDGHVIRALGLDRLPSLPKAFWGKLEDLGTEVMLGLYAQHGLRLVEAREAPPSVHARYIGLRLEPAPG